MGGHSSSPPNNATNPIPMPNEATAQDAASRALAAAGRQDAIASQQAPNQPTASQLGNTNSNIPAPRAGSTNQASAAPASMVPATGGGISNSAVLTG